MLPDAREKTRTIAMFSVSCYEYMRTVVANVLFCWCCVFVYLVSQGPEGSTPVIMLILDDEHAHQMRTAGMEVKARGADVIIITDKPAVSFVLCCAVLRFVCAYCTCATHPPAACGRDM